MTTEFEVLGREQVAERFPGALEKLQIQRKSPTEGTWVKIGGIGPGQWSFGIADGQLHLFNSVFHGTDIGDYTYKLTYVWDGGQWRPGMENLRRSKFGRLWRFLKKLLARLRKS